MNMLKSKRTLAVAGALALGVGTTGAIAASKGSATSGNGFLARVAGHLGISTQKLEDATKAAAIDQVDADLKAGRITKAQADEMKARINEEVVPLFFGGPHRFGDFGHRGGRPGGFGFGFHRGGHLSAAADYLGLTVPQLLQKLSGGSSLADVAKAQGKSVDGLEEAMLADAKTHLDQAVKDGMLTKAQAAEMLSELRSRIDQIVNGTFRGPGGRREFHRRGGPPGDAGLGFLPPAA
jgi:ribosomal protein S20